MTMPDASQRRSAPSPLRLKQEVDRACDRFEEAWLAGEPPDLAAYLQGFPEPGRVALLRELLPTELEYRSDCGEAIAQADYLVRLAEYADVVEEVFAQRPPGGHDYEADLIRHCTGLIEAVRHRLAGPGAAVLPAAGLAERLREGGFVAARRASPLPPEHELWRRLLIAAMPGGREDGRHEASKSCFQFKRPGGPRSPDEVATLERLVADLLEPFRTKRRQILKNILLGHGISDTARQFQISERTVTTTCRAAADLLPGRSGA